MSLNNQKEFLDKLKKYFADNSTVEGNYLKHNYFKGSDTNNNDRLLIENLTFTQRILRNINFDFIHFKNCEFLDCQIDYIDSNNTIYEKCTFTNSFISKAGFYECDLINCNFNRCMLNYFLYSSTSLSDVEFNYCNEILDFYFGGTFSSNVSFRNSYVAHTRFDINLVGDEINNYAFINSTISNCYFDNNDLRKSVFENCTLNNSIFANCILLSSTFTESNSTENNEYASIDFHTINKSEIINAHILRNVFGITEGDIKSFIQGLSNDVLLQSVFISYSFEDKLFANRLNESLKAKGVLTFLWEKDAPGGRPLKRIMMENVKKFDRLLFIASENSIKSQACQFELSEGRKKQDFHWTTVLFPIHIDNFIFELDKEDIKPRDKQDEYWQNILELKNIYSIDFSGFNNLNSDQFEFEKFVSRLVENLKTAKTNKSIQ